MLRVFIIDDDPYILFYLAEVISLEGHEAMMFGGAHEALAGMACEPKPDLVITDLRMDGMSGEDLLVQMKRRPDLSAIPVVVMSGFFEGDSRERLMNLGARMALAKPMTFLQIREALATVTVT